MEQPAQIFAVAEFPPADLGGAAFAIGFIAAVSLPRFMSMLIRSIVELVK